MTLFFHSTTLFCWGVMGAENSWAMPVLVQNCSNWEFSNSLSWSLWRRFIITHFSFCNLLHKIFIFWGALDLNFSKIAHVNLIKLSTTTMIYLLRPRDSVLAGPMRSIWSSSSGLAVAMVKVAWLWAFPYFPSWHSPQTALSTLTSLGMPNKASFLDIIDSCL